MSNKTRCSSYWRSEKKSSHFTYIIPIYNVLNTFFIFVDEAPLAVARGMHLPELFASQKFAPKPCFAEFAKIL